MMKQWLWLALFWIGGVLSLLLFARSVRWIMGVVGLTG